MRKKGWILLLVLLGVAFLMSCGKDMEPDEAKGELERRMPSWYPSFLNWKIGWSCTDYRNDF